MSEIRPFKVDVPAEEVERLKRKLNDTRLPGREIVPGAGSDYGPSYTWAETLFNEWKNNYDWPAAQASLNATPQYLTEIESVTIHFAHIPSPDPSSAIPILLVHGWPGSFYEFHRLWQPLSNPPAGQPAFNVVAPNMPGFCWSSWPPRKGWTMKDNARIFDVLMKRLGYEEYMVQCGDWAHWVGRELGSKYTDSCKVVHCNFAPSIAPGEPHTIGLALHDNPMGILMWVGEKYEELANPSTLAKPSWTQDILTTVSLYYFSECIMPSMLPYVENVRHHQFAEAATHPDNRITVPFGFTSFFYDSQPASKRSVERTANLVFYRERDEAGHFAALECPEGLTKDLRELALQEWKFS
ncbi:epoxide hydrolase [Colletotrichum karsti]|uniref:Epoxide hydrolase n=1 Tax=Colletotrichum karsti TaxID=1095194 RepID=A0A9P6LFH2_9PEZI|nr:epoxide hydrolase [Colletotrichum karsti]KAF9871171.1 epoxide hydrolase [Colletotrichum karsti]